MNTKICILFLALFLPRAYAIAPIPPKVVQTPPIGQISPLNGIVAPNQTLPITQIEAYATEQAKIYGIDPIKILWILSRESQDCQNLTGDDGNSRGCMMISSIYHPEVSKDCAMDLQCSLRWSLNFMAKSPNNMNQWTTWRYRCTWFPNENPPYCR